VHSRFHGYSGSLDAFKILHLARREVQHAWDLAIEEGPPPERLRLINAAFEREVEAFEPLLTQLRAEWGEDPYPAPYPYGNSVSLLDSAEVHVRQGFSELLAHGARRDSELEALRETIWQGIGACLEALRYTHVPQHAQVMGPETGRSDFPTWDDLRRHNRQVAEAGGAGCLVAVLLWPITCVVTTPSLIVGTVIGRSRGRRQHRSEVSKPRFL